MLYETLASLACYAVLIHFSNVLGVIGQDPDHNTLCRDALTGLSIVFIVIAIGCLTACIIGTEHKAFFVIETIWSLGVALYSLWVYSILKRNTSHHDL